MKHSIYSLKQELYKKKLVSSIASISEISENQVESTLEDFRNNLDGEKFSHKEFIDYFVDLYFKKYEYDLPSK